MITAFHVVCILWFFALGAVVGSFLNVCIYRLPWQKSVIWPASHCPKCLAMIAVRDNVPVLSWIALRGECRHCGQRIAARYALIEALVGMLFVAVYLVDVGFGSSVLFAGNAAYGQVLYHQVLVALLVAATFTDFDYQVIPDEITRIGMILGVLIGAAFPDVRPVPAGPAFPGLMGTWGGFFGALPWAAVGGIAGWALQLLIDSVFRVEPSGTGRAKPAEAAKEEEEETFGWPTIGAFLGWQLALRSSSAPWGGLVVGLQGMAVGAAIVWVVRVMGSRVFRKEAMGFGDVTLLAMIGAFLGWQGAVLTFFVAPFFGLAHALGKLAKIVVNKLRGRKSKTADHEMPFGPYLSMAALLLVLTWPRLWPTWKPMFEQTGVALRFLLTGEL